MPSARLCVLRARWKRIYFELYSKMEADIRADIKEMKTLNTNSPFKNGKYLKRILFYCKYIYLLYAYDLYFIHEYMHVSTCMIQSARCSR